MCLVGAQTSNTEYTSIRKEFSRTAVDRSSMIQTRVDLYMLGALAFGAPVPCRARCTRHAVLAVGTAVVTLRVSRCSAGGHDDDARARYPCRGGRGLVAQVQRLH
jgi:hypothetical protein